MSLHDVERDVAVINERLSNYLGWQKSLKADVDTLEATVRAMSNRLSELDKVVAVKLAVIGGSSGLGGAFMALLAEHFMIGS